MADLCLAATGIAVPWLLVGAALLIIVVGAAAIRGATARRRMVAVGVVAVAAMVIAGPVAVPSPAFAASTGETAIDCPAEQMPAGPAPAVPPAPGAPPLPPTSGLVGAALGDYIWIDTDRDGVQDPGEPPAVGTQITLLDAGSGLPVTTGFDGRPIAATQTSDDTGRYRFTALAAGGYRVSVDAGRSVQGETVDLSYGTYDTRLTIRDRAGITVFDSDIRKAQCTGSGYFSVVLPGTGHVVTDSRPPQPGDPPFTVTAGRVVAFVTTADAGDDALDSDIDSMTRQTTDPIALAEGQDVSAVDIGLDPAFGRYSVDQC